MTDTELDLNNVITMSPLEIKELTGKPDHSKICADIERILTEAEIGVA